MFDTFFAVIIFEIIGLSYGISKSSLWRWKKRIAGLKLVFERDGGRGAFCFIDIGGILSDGKSEKMRGAGFLYGGLREKSATINTLDLMAARASPLSPWSRMYGNDEKVKDGGLFWNENLPVQGIFLNFRKFRPEGNVQSKFIHCRWNTMRLFFSFTICWVFMPKRQLKQASLYGKYHRYRGGNRRVKKRFGKNFLKKCINPDEYVDFLWFGHNFADFVYTA